MSEEPVEGPGARTRDGSPVELYRRLAHLGEVERFAQLVPPSHTILELGCGAGRMTRELLARGHPVTCVDNSEDMLALLPPGARKVLADIETLDLARTFDMVLLASCLVNVPEAGLRQRLVAACRRHLEAEGLLVFERQDPAWLEEAVVGPAGSIGAIDVFVDRVERRGDEVEMSLRYRDAADEWTHSFLASRIDDAAMAELLEAHGFGAPTWLDPRRRWGAAMVRE